jgi:hypothetical protein
MMDLEMSSIRASPYYGGVMLQYDEFEQLIRWVTCTVSITSMVLLLYVLTLEFLEAFLAFFFVLGH